MQALVLGEALEAYVKIQKGEALGGYGGFSTLGMHSMFEMKHEHHLCYAKGINVKACVRPRTA
jgi:hypothetical protein